MRKTCLWMVALGVLTSCTAITTRPVAAQHRLAEAEAILRQFSTESGVGVTLGNQGGVEINLPDRANSPFARNRTNAAPNRARVETDASGLRVLVDPPSGLTQNHDRARRSVDVQGILDQFAPNVRVHTGGVHTGGVQLNHNGIKLDTRDGVNVDLETPSGRVQISQRAIEDYAAARKSFYANDYRQAALRMESAVARMPREAKFRQFHALARFAMGEFALAADEAHQALSLGEPWDWPTLRAFYADPAEYAAQYRRLQQVAEENDQSVELNFLLAYHHMMLGHYDAALQSWRQVNQLFPDDPVVMARIRQLEDRPVPVNGRP